MSQVVPFEPVYINRFLTGLNTQRSPLVTPFSYAGLTKIDRLDALIDGLNIELSNSGTLQRRPGFSKYSPNALNAGEVPRNVYSWRDANGTIRTVFDLTSKVAWVSDSARIDYFTPADTNKPWSFVSILDTLYCANGSEAKKVLVSGAVSKMGIAAPITRPTVGVTSGSLSPTSGYRWSFLFKNSTTQHVSSGAPITPNIGPQTNKGFSLAGERSTDPQVDKIEIYRTKDGGSTLFFVAEIANPGSGTWSYVDNTPDENLDTSRICPLYNANDPPPTGIKNLCFHMGRMWGSVGNKVYYNAGGDCINGVPEEAWPPLNYFTFPGDVIAVLTMSFGLLVFLTNDSYVIRGYDPSSFVPQRWLAGLGILSPFALATDGSRLFVYTSNRQFVALSDSADEIGFVIGDKLPGWIDPATAYVTAHRQGSDAAIYVSDGSGNMLRYSLSQGAWSPRYVVEGGCKMVQSIETTPGTTTLLMGRATASGHILKRDTSVFSDDGVIYSSAYVTFGSIVLMTPGFLVDVESILTERTAAGSEPQLSLLPNEISGTFITLTNPVNEPPELDPATSLIAKRYYLRDAAVPVPHLMRHLQVKITFPPEAAKNELLGLCISPRTPQ